jgi:hypothetical protein
MTNVIGNPAVILVVPVPAEMVIKEHKYGDYLIPANENKAVR